MNNWTKLKDASFEELVEIIGCWEQLPVDSLFDAAREARHKNYGALVFVRGLIEMTNYCKNDCFYCGLRAGNNNLIRYRLDIETILACCETGYRLGLRSFVLQGGEDPLLPDDWVVMLIQQIKTRYPDCALTLSLGEKTTHTYKRYKNAGADRYLLRHETANTCHYAKIHPKEMNFESRKNCLNVLKSLGFQVGAGFMVGLPYQTPLHLAEDLLFLKDLKPHMVGIGPFIPQKDTPFALEQPGELMLTLIMLALARILVPDALLPATTAVSTLSTKGRILALEAGANVVMPNLSPLEHRKDYALYDNKAFLEYEAAENIELTLVGIRASGLTPSLTRGDHCEKI